jgi:hypothetical protein
MKQARMAIAVLAAALILVGCRASALTNEWGSAPNDPTNTQISAGDAPTSPVPPGNSSRAVRPPGPGAVHPGLQLLPDAPADTWRVYFFATPEPTGEPIAVGEIEDLYPDAVWLDALPDAEPAAQPRSALWVRNVELKGGAMRFYAWSDGGVRVWVNGRPVIDQWDGSESNRAMVGDVWIDRSGSTEVLVAFRPTDEEGRLKLWWERVTWFTGWRGEYFANRYLAGQPLVVRNDAMPVFDWGLDAPAQGMPSDDFSVRWSRTVAFEGGCYRFVAEADDGVRVYVNDALLINAWQETAESPWVREAYLESGNHLIVVEYFDAEGPARVSVDWQRVIAEESASEGAQVCGTSASETETPLTRSNPSPFFDRVTRTLRILYFRLVGPPIWW